MIKATILLFVQRADGWCESVKEKICPLLEPAVKAARLVPFSVLY